MKYLCPRRTDVDAFSSEDSRVLRVVEDAEKNWRLYLWDTYTSDKYGKHRLAYRLISYLYSPSEPTVVFEGADYFCSPLHYIDSDDSVVGLLSFLSLREEDTDDEYFNDYTPAQIAWRDAEAEELSNWLTCDLQDDRGCVREGVLVDVEP